MLPILPAYQAPDTTAIVNGSVADADPVRGLVESGNGVNSRLVQLSNNAFVSLTNADNNYNIKANEDVQIVTNATSGAFAINLPPLSTQFKPISITGVGSAFNWVTINCDGSDKIDSLSLAEVTPTNDETYIYTGGHGFTLIPTPAGWRHVNVIPPKGVFVARMSANQALTNSTGNSVFAFDTVVQNTLGTFNTGQRRLTPKIPGRYQVMAKTLWVSGTSSLLLINITGDFGAGAVIRDQFNYTTANSETTTTQRLSLDFDGADDWIEIQGRTQGANRTISADAPNDRLTYWQVTFLGF